MVDRAISKRRRIMREFVIKELSAVDRPAQAHALMTIMKRADDTDDDLEKAIHTTSRVNDYTHTYNDARSGRTSSANGHTHPYTVSPDGKVTIGEAAGHTHEPADVDKAWSDEARAAALAARRAKGGKGTERGLDRADAAVRMFRRSQESHSPRVDRASTKLVAAGYPKARVHEAVVQAWDDHGGEASVTDLTSTAEEHLLDWGVMPRTRKGYDTPASMAQQISALSFDDVLAQREAREAACTVRDNVWARWNALQSSFDTISGDDDVAPAQKVAAMQESLRQFMASLKSDVLTKAITKSLSAVPALAGLLEKIETEGESDMTTAAQKQQLAECQKKIDALTKSLADEDADAKEIGKQIAALNAEFTELTKRFEAGDTEHAELVAKASMSDSEKEHLAGLPAAEKAKFMAAKPDERKKLMSKAADDNPVVYKSERTGEEFRKNDDARLVKYAKQADEDAEIAKAERTKRETAELAKRADDELKVFSDDIAKREDKIEVLRAVDKMEEGPRKALLKMLEVGGKAISAAFETIGHKKEAMAKGANDFNKRVEEIMVRDKVTKLVALDKAEKEFPDDFKAYQESGAILSN